MAKFIPFRDRNYGPLGPQSAELIRRIEGHSARNYEPYPFVVYRAQGPWLFDPDGNKALDFLSAYSAVLSHGHEGVIEAVKREMEHGCDLVSRALFSVRYADFVELVAQLTGYDRVLSKSDGGSATDSAISGLLMHGHERGIENPEVILTKDYFHGRTWIFASNALFDPDQSNRRVPRAPGVVVADDDVEAIEAAINENTVGIFVETHKGEGGPLFSTKDHYMAIRRLATERDIFFGADEIQTGLGRCGYMMAWQEYGDEARPDFVTLGKALGGGIIPVSAVVGTEQFMRIYTPGSDGSTFGGYSLACAAACASLEYIDREGIPKRAKELGDYFVRQLEGIEGVTVDHRGLLIRVELEGVDTAKHSCLEMLLGQGRDPRIFMKHGHYNPKTRRAYTRIAPPPGAMTEALIDQAVERTIAPVLSQARCNI
ncbi:aminotransferase class III-fold pyridoxal phosphate-dependent enzyme [Candidatus Woesearchaeota archaeon]|nr:aminotransferase class III-fold pyridoxal phosphate-dependent enzyme [Candidatus Woesearchaeota archaeon]